ncbi:MAG TPA: glucose-6-phosphate dehydrogenase assembly protein OpcA [Planctomycetota bacterium]|nr:glucose-6-phosphate dehydrogenase assembly protein OpcA [Planctomycetota bacterium]
MDEAPSPALQRYGSGKQLDLVAIERELQQLWKSAAEASAREGGGPVTRACSMTLVAACSNDMQLQHVTRVVESVAASNPGRAILVRVDLEDAEPRLDAEVSAMCSTSGRAGQPRVCHEQVRLHASGSRIDAVASALVALLVPDVPAYVWAPCEKLLARPLVAAMAQDADALVLDSRRLSDPWTALGRAWELTLEHRGHPLRRFGLHDLAWASLRPWFDAVARTLTAGGPETDERVRTIERIRVGHVGRDGAPRESVSALLLAAWIASRLGWSSLGGRVDLVPTAGQDRPGSVTWLECVAPSGSVRLERDAKADRIHCGVGVTERASGFRSIDDAEALGATIASAPFDSVFETALPLALELARRP